MMDWKELSRSEQNALQCLYGGGSLRNCDSVVILRLRQLDLIEGKDRRERLSHLGWAFMDFTHAQLKARLGAETRRDDGRGNREGERDAAPPVLQEVALSP